MRNNLNQLLLTEVNDKLTDVQQKAQWQSEATSRLALVML